MRDYSERGDNNILSSLSFACEILGIDPTPARVFTTFLLYYDIIVIHVFYFYSNFFIIIVKKLVYMDLLRIFAPNKLTPLSIEQRA